MNTDRTTTALGAVAAVIQTANVDFPKLFQGDRTEIGKLLLAAITAVWAYFTNKK